MRQRGALWAGILAGLPWSALAQEAPPATAPPDVANIEELSLEDLLAAPVVESASKRKQSLEEAPGAITVFDADEIVRAGRLDLVDVMRRVPGAWVLHTGANQFDIGLRGVGRISNKGVLVLLNGRRLVDPTNFPIWRALPVNVAEIERIEVLRGPGGTLYGADALSGVVNIVTRAPGAGAGNATEASFAAGIQVLPDAEGPARSRQHNLGGGYAAQNVWSPSLSAGLRLSAGFRGRPEWEDPNAGNFVYHGNPGYHAAASGTWERGAGRRLALDVRHVLGESRAIVGSITAPLIMTTEETAATLHGETPLAGDWLALKATLDARRMTLSWATRSATGEALQPVDPTEEVAHALVQADATLLGGKNVLTLAAEGSIRETDGLYGSAFGNAYAGLVVQNELALLDRRLVASGAARYEVIWAHSHGAGEPEARYANLNPRLSLVGRLGRDHTLRVSAATAYRTPSPTEAFVDVAQAAAADMPGLRAPRVVAANPTLRPERSRSVEVGYRGRPRPWLRLDVTAFGQQVRDLIDFDGTDLPLAYYNLEDDDTLGVELGAQVRPSERFRAFASYAHVRELDDHGRWPKHVGGVGLDVALGQATSVGADAFFVSEAAPRVFTLDVANNRLAFQPVATTTLPIVNLRASHAPKDVGFEVFFQGSHLLAMTQGVADLRPVGAASSPIGMTILLGIATKGGAP